MNTTNILNNLVEKKNMTAEEINIFLSDLINGNVNSIQGGAILTALKIKGETPEEINGLIKTMRKNMVSINLNNAIDVCGTGGDDSGSFNISTAVALVVAGCGVKVAKHGNRAASSKCGSADVLESLGVNIKLNPTQAQQVFKKIGMVFLFAPIYHPAMKNIVNIRKELKIRTIFNYLGPFINPSCPVKQLVGVPNKEIAQKLADVSKKLNYKHLLIVTSEDGMDEISIYSKTFMFEINKNQIKNKIIDPQDYKFNKTNKKEILGGDTVDNAKIIKNILNGVKGPQRDLVVFNSAFALYVAGSVIDINQGIKLAEDSIDSGSAKLVLENLIKETQRYG